MIYLLFILIVLIGVGVWHLRLIAKGLNDCHSLKWQLDVSQKELKKCLKKNKIKV